VPGWAVIVAVATLARAVPVLVGIHVVPV
jgi:hypothetical protein